MYIIYEYNIVLYICVFQGKMGMPGFPGISGIPVSICSPCVYIIYQIPWNFPIEIQLKHFRASLFC